MTRALALLLATASAVLPTPHRARWREESMAVLLAVSGRRRWHFACDIMLKAPLLAWQLRQLGAGGPTRPWMSTVAGAGLLSTPVLLVGALLLAPVVGEDAAEFLFLVAPCGMLPAVATRSLGRAARRGGGPVRYAGVALLSLFCGTGPIAAGALSVATGRPAVALIGAALPGLWLVRVSGTALTRRQGPAQLNVLGVLAGTALVGVLLGLQLSLLTPGLGAFATVVSALSLAVLVLTYPVWSVWGGIRLLRGRRELTSPG